MKKKAASYIWLTVVVLLLIGLDQLVKAWAVEVLAGHGAPSSIDVIPGVFRFSYVENRGMAFGMMQGMTVLLSVASVLVAALLVIFYKNIPMKPYGKFLRLIFMLIIAGALGNLIDRVFRGFVVDMFDFCLINFPVFNVADCFVVIGGILAIGTALFKGEWLDHLFDFRTGGEVDHG